MLVDVVSRAWDFSIGKSVFICKLKQVRRFLFVCFLRDLIEKHSLIKKSLL